MACSYGLKSVPTGAMLPTIPIDSYIVTDERAYLGEKPIERFNNVIHNAPVDKNLETIGIDKNTKFVFRVIGLGGEKIEIRNGKGFINNNELVETFEIALVRDDFEPMIIPKDEYFLLGDNRPNSNDSRHWESTTIKRMDIVGKVVKNFSLWKSKQ